MSELRLKAATGRLKIVSEDGIGALLPLAPTLEKLVSLFSSEPLILLVNIEKFYP